MSHLIGIVGKPSSGKSTFFNAATLAGAEMASYPFTTIKPNEAVGYVTTECPCKELNTNCNPKNSVCKDGTRMIPVKLLDVAGLVPGAHEGKGMGNQFLDDLRQASVLIHIVDCSGTTNEKGEPTKGYNPEEDIKFLEEEIGLWLFQVIKNNWSKMARKAAMEKRDMIKAAAENLAGLGIKESHITEAVKDLTTKDMDKWDDNTLKDFAFHLRKLSKPIIIAANKMDTENAENNLKKLKEKYKDMIIIPVSSAVELGLRKAAKSNIIDYTPGDSSFSIKNPGRLDNNQKKGIEFMKAYLDKHNNTGVQKCLNSAIFDLLNYITAYPVENENKYSDRQGNVLPDAFLIPKGRTAKEFAYLVHTDIGDAFIHAIDCKTHRRISADHIIEDNDIIKIVSAAK